MFTTPELWLRDILRACDLITEFIGPRQFEEYQQDALRVSAVERQLGIIGEAVVQVLKLEPQAPLTETRRIVGFRNILIHNYARVSQAVVWTVIHDHLPTLQHETQQWLYLLNEENS